MTLIPVVLLFTLLLVSGLFFLSLNFLMKFSFSRFYPSFFFISLSFLILASLSTFFIPTTPLSDNLVPQSIEEEFSIIDKRTEYSLTGNELFIDDRNSTIQVTTEFQNRQTVEEQFKQSKLFINGTNFSSHLPITFATNTLTLPEDLTKDVTIQLLAQPQILQFYESTSLENTNIPNEFSIGNTQYNPTSIHLLVPENTQITYLSGK